MVQLDASTMARMIGPRHETGYYTSSGSEHSIARDSDRGSDTSEHSKTRSLSDLVECFLEESCQEGNEEDDVSHGVNGDSDAESTHRVDSVKMVLYEELKQIVSDDEDYYRNVLISQVHQALETLSLSRSSFETMPFQSQKTVVRGVMSRLRNLGHNAAVCKTKWDTSKSGGLVSGSHEFIDVVTTNSCSNHPRYIIDLDFASKFEIARPTESYKRLFELLPKAVIVATEEEMRRIVKLMSDEAKKSLKSRELHLPPWRKNRYMQMKWFGPYKRTTNALPGGARSGLDGGGGGVGRWNVECRAVGFEPACNGVKGHYFVSTR